MTAAGYRSAEELIGRLGPVAAVQKGSYDLPSLGDYVLATLAGCNREGQPRCLTVANDMRPSTVMSAIRICR